MYSIHIGLYSHSYCIDLNGPLNNCMPVMFYDAVKCLFTSILFINTDLYFWNKIYLKLCFLVMIHTSCCWKHEAATKSDFHYRSTWWSPPWINRLDFRWLALIVNLLSDSFLNPRCEATAHFVTKHRTLSPWPRDDCKHLLSSHASSLRHEKRPCQPHALPHFGFGPMHNPDEYKCSLRKSHVLMQLSSIASCNCIRSLWNNNLMVNVWNGALLPVYCSPLR